MNAPNNKFPYNRRIPRHKRKRQPKSAALKNPYLEVAKPDDEPKTKNPNRSVAARKAKPPKDDRLDNQRLFRKSPSRFAKHILGVEP